MDMVRFSNIKIKDNYIIAFAEDLDNGHKENIKAKLDKTMHSSDNIDIIYATWCLIDRYGRKKKFPENATVVYH